MDINSNSGFPPQSYSTAFNLRNEIKQYLMSKGLSKLKNGVLRVNSSSNKMKPQTQLLFAWLMMANLTAFVSATCYCHITEVLEDLLQYGRSDLSQEYASLRRSIAEGAASKDSWRSGCCVTGKRQCRKQHEDSSLLKFLALNALELSAPASDALLRSQQMQGSNQAWFQLSGHPDAFAPAGPGTIWKKCSGGDEKAVYEALAGEPELRGITPAYLRHVNYGSQSFIELQDLLYGFRDPNVMDVKLGTRTFLESEVENTVARHDLYLKMVGVDPDAPTEEEHNSQAVTKMRYMQFREQQSSTCSLGFRIEAMKFRGSPPVTDLKRVKSDEEVIDTMSLFFGGRGDVRQRLLTRLTEIKNVLDQSVYFKKHEVVGSSILILYDDTKVGAWLIDFAKTREVPEDITLNHRVQWEPGNHEEGFLFGLDNLIKVLGKVPSKSSPPNVTPTKPLALKS